MEENIDKRNKCQEQIRRDTRAIEASKEEQQNDVFYISKIKIKERVIKW